MQSLVTIGLFTVAGAAAFVAWKAMEPAYVAAKRLGGPEWVKVERETVLVVLGAGAAALVLAAWLAL